MNDERRFAFRGTSTLAGGAKAAPDGNTLLYGFNQLVTLNPSLFTQTPSCACQRYLAPLPLRMPQRCWCAPRCSGPLEVGGEILLAIEVVASRRVAVGAIVESAQQCPWDQRPS